MAYWRTRYCLAMQHHLVHATTNLHQSHLITWIKESSSIEIYGRVRYDMHKLNVTKSIRLLSLHCLVVHGMNTTTNRKEGRTKEGPKILEMRKSGRHTFYYVFNQVIIIHTTMTIHHRLRQSSNKPTQLQLIQSFHNIPRLLHSTTIYHKNSLELKP